MKTVYGKVSCEFRPTNSRIEAYVPDDATAEQIEAALRDAAIEHAGFEFWQTDERGWSKK